MNNTIEPTVQETCVSCQTKTEYTRDQPVVTRHYYVEGAGQLCKTCYEKIYN